MQCPVVLLSEKEPVIAHVLRLGLEAQCFQVIEVENPLELGHYCQKYRPAGVILNHQTGSGRNGTTLAAALARQWQMPVLIVTGAGHNEVLPDAAADSRLQVLFKPFSPGQMQRCLSNWLPEAGNR